MRKLLFIMLTISLTISGCGAKTSIQSLETEGFALQNFQQLWNDLQAEQQLGLPLSIPQYIEDEERIFLQATIQVPDRAIKMNVTIVQPRPDSTLSSLTIKASPNHSTEESHFLNASALAIQVEQIINANQSHTNDRVNRVFHKMGIHANARLANIVKSPNFSTSYVEQETTYEIRYENEKYHFSIQYDAADEGFTQSALTQPAFASISTLADVSNSRPKRTNLSYLYFGNPSQYVGQVDRTNNTVTTVAPNYFDLTTGGKLDVTWKLNQTFITEMKQRGIKVVPFLSNHWDRQIGIDALQRSEELTTEIAAAVERYQLDGVNVDIEGVGATYRSAFTEFVRLLRSKVPQDKEVSVAVAANPNGWLTGWHGFYDYSALTRYADYLMMMSYDESWEGGPPGPVSSLSFFERSLQYAVQQGVPPEKIVMGIPFYGRLWKLNETTTPTQSSNNIQPINGIGVSNHRVESIVRDYNGEHFYDQTTASPYVMFEIGSGQGRYIAGKWCDAGQYILWYENEQSIKQKLKVIARAGVRGAGSWSLYQEADGTWDFFSLWLNGRYYRDVSEQHWAYLEIKEIAENGWMSGVNATDFAPQTSLTRAQATVILARALNIPQNQLAPPVFRDLPTTHWGYHLIASAYQQGIIRGTQSFADGTIQFSPDEPMTREQLSVFLARILQTESATSPSPSPSPSQSP
jgi:spore germination protein YaaH